MSARTVPGSAGVVVIGGGIMGVACAYELAKAGVRDVVLLERDALGEGSTSKAAGGVRAQFSDRLNVALGARSLETFENFAAIFDTEIDLHQVGYLFLLETPEAVATFEESARLQRELGLVSEIITPAEAQARSPFISTEGLLAAAWTPRDGHCTPESVVAGYARAARRHGATLLTGTPATGIDVRDGRIRAVQTPGGRIETDTVVCAAGAWSAEVGRWVGVDLPVEPMRRQILLTDAVPGLRPDTPFTIDLATSFYFHNEGRGLLLGMSWRDETPGFRLGRSDEWTADLAEVMERRVPSLTDLCVCSGWAGLYENTPDHNALIGEARGLDRFLYATGFSGHGFLQGPAVGEVMRDLVLGAQPFVDVAALSADRFAAADVRPEFNIV